MASPHWRFQWLSLLDRVSAYYWRTFINAYGTTVAPKWRIKKEPTFDEHHIVAAQPLPNLQPAIDGGFAFLHGQFNEAYDLLQESPEIGQHRCYLTNDNFLAAHVLEHYGEADLAATLRTNLDRHNISGNGSAA